MWGKHWVIFTGVGNRLEFFTLKLVVIPFQIHDFSHYEHFSKNHVRKFKDTCITFLDKRDTQKQSTCSICPYC